jgi:hypothetical protein
MRFRPIQAIDPNPDKGMNVAQTRSLRMAKWHSLGGDLSARDRTSVDLSKETPHTSRTCSLISVVSSSKKTSRHRYRSYITGQWFDTQS